MFEILTIHTIFITTESDSARSGTVVHSGITNLVGCSQTATARRTSVDMTPEIFEYGQTICFLSEGFLCAARVLDDTVEKSNIRIGRLRLSMVSTHSGYCRGGLNENGIFAPFSAILASRWVFSKPSRPNSSKKN